MTRSLHHEYRLLTLLSRKQRFVEAVVTQAITLRIPVLSILSEAAMFRKHQRVVAPAHHYVADVDFEIVSRRGRSSPTRATLMKESPIIAPQGQGPFGPTSRSLFGIQPVRPTTRSGTAKILAIVTLDRMNQESRNRLDGTCPMPLIVKGSQDGRNVTRVHMYPMPPGGGQMLVGAGTVRPELNCCNQAVTLKCRCKAMTSE